MEFKLTWHSWCIDKVHNMHLQGILLACTAISGSGRGRDGVCATVMATDAIVCCFCLRRWSRPSTLAKVCCRLWRPTAGVFYSWCFRGLGRLAGDDSMEHRCRLHLLLSIRAPPEEQASLQQYHGRVSYEAACCVSTEQAPQQGKRPQYLQGLHAALVRRQVLRQ